MVGTIPVFNRDDSSPSERVHNKKTLDYSVSQLPTSDKWLYVDLEYPEAYPA